MDNCRLWMIVTLALTLHLLPSLLVDGFNFSPRANLVISTPRHLSFQLNQTRSSYFGYTLVIRPTSVIVGAPRAQSSLESQRQINETGAIYRCSLTTGACNPYVLDPNGNRDAPYSEYTFDSERKDFQWLGGSMDGGTSDEDKLLVCAPRFYAPSAKDYHMHGVCYWVQNTLASSPQHVNRISPLRLKSDQVVQADSGNEINFYYILGELGLSAHVSDDNSKFLIGAPGIYTWKGSVILYGRVDPSENPSVSRRDTSSALRRKTRESDSSEYTPDNFVPEIPKPQNWGQQDDSYFGYAVASGYFDSSNLTNLLYVATAPQANRQSGEAYIFDVLGKTIKKFHVFRGEQFGEYFGYSVLAEDLNGDGRTDVVISAPQHSQEDSHDNGAIYIFINKGFFNFESKLLRSPIASKARFGTTLTRLGDINHDGYNDIAVGAPFAGNGSVFIYLGSEHGLRNLPSQRLDSPSALPSKYGAHMFGHGLSRGSDIDGNGFNDFAIGAPNAEAVYLYRAYPVVRLKATVKSQSREIKPEQDKVAITACYGITTTATAPAVQKQEMSIRIVIDSQLKRAKFTQTQSHEISFTVDAGLTEQCRVFECIVRYSEKDIFTPIELEMHYELTKKVPDSEDFCQTCVAVDPSESKVYTEKIIFSTGCATDICIADLQVKSKEVSPTYTLGSGSTIRLNYEITNNGETAYLPQFNVTSVPHLSFAQIPGNCRVSDTGMVCDLNRGRPLAKGDRDVITISFDVSTLSGVALIINAEVFSTGYEKNPMDNRQTNVISLREYTEIDATGGQINGQIDLEHYKNSAEIINNYEIKSNGPSIIDDLTLSFLIPIAYKIAGSTAVIPIINITTLKMQATYDAQLLGIELFNQNNTRLILDPIEISTPRGIQSTERTVLRQNGQGYDITTSGHVHQSWQELDADRVATASMTRKRRDLKALTANREQYARISNAKAHDLLSEDFKGKLPVNRTIVFNCRDPDMTICVRAEMHVYNFRADKPVNLNVRYSVDLNEVNAILLDPWEYFVILTDMDLLKKGDLSGSSFSINRKIEPNVISKHLQSRTPIWIIIVSIIGGLLLLSAISYALYKFGFFNRAKKEELNRLVKQSPDEPEAENLNSDGNN
ncbi:integrin alpha-PS3 isoform X2 [Drosophila guanche]|uniref:Blast:Integrin alpha-PS3 n=1 Tax=Drosophila guanche TaxID=7266 RepID=A0A3B0JT85_DROGU|nr:integrin alpha-PS3 isoform X2 [Drosophila guanche]SPP75911.1 blast:Integrin alpha-PS3 [Drosophila guanche]